MEKRPSSLFVGTHFDRNRFAKDIARFKPNEVQEDYQEHVYREFQLTELNGNKKEKKRKRRDSVVVEGFNVFKSSKSLKTSDATTNLEDDFVLHRKEVEKQIELDSLFRKKYGIHISGYSVPSPIRNFDELKSRFGCKSHLLRNFYELRFKEPTPIQMQAISILLAGREYFACAPTGSGKTLAFLIPILMKIKSFNPPILVFVQSKERAKELYKELAFDDIKEDVIHADLTQEQREDAVDNFRAGKTWVLIATDVIARGMDFKGINCVINYDFPESVASYIHRIDTC